ncbi:2-oxo-tetronate isomerase [Aquabacterium sp.]|uniref:2-oxo-tetronate isomerase n=1 Tax=Aquabacterium sp. TaxID=1872578 RepID=UPI003783816C
MPRFAANLSLMYTEHPLLERFDAAARDGFDAVEMQFPYAQPAAALQQRLHDAGLQQVLINAPPGAPGEAGLASLPGREEELRRSFAEQALPYAQALGSPRIHVMAGRLPLGADRERHRATYLANLAWAAAQAATAGIAVLIEPLNPRDMPGYFLSRQAEAHAIVAEVGVPNLQVQMDLYHCQITEGDLTVKLRTLFADPAARARLGHLQIAGVPDRHEPDEGELHHPHLFALLDTLGYAEPIGAEYRPRGATSAGLAWFAPYRSSRALRA